MTAQGKREKRKAKKVFVFSDQSGQHCVEVRLVRIEGNPTWFVSGAFQGGQYVLNERRGNFYSPSRFKNTCLHHWAQNQIFRNRREEIERAKERAHARECELAALAYLAEKRRLSEHTRSRQHG